MHLLCSNSLLFTLYSFAWLFCIVLAFLLTFFRYARALWRNWVSTRASLGRGGGGGSAQKSIMRGGTAPNPFDFYIQFLTRKGTLFLYLLLTYGTPFTPSIEP